MGATIVWWVQEHTPPPWIGARTGNTFHPIHRDAGWTGRQYHLGMNNEAFDAELYALFRALRAFDDGEERGRRHTIFSDSAAAMDRIATDQLGAGKRLAAEAIATCTRFASHDNTVTVRWSPTHLGAGGDEVADL